MTPRWGSTFIFRFSQQLPRIIVLDPWRAFWADKAPFKGPRLCALLPELQRIIVKTLSGVPHLAQRSQVTVMNNWRKPWWTLLKTHYFLTKIGGGRRKRTHLAPPVLHLSVTLLDLMQFNVHVASVHLKAKPYMCKNCNFATSRRAFLASHLESSHKVKGDAINDHININQEEMAKVRRKHLDRKS